MHVCVFLVNIVYACFHTGQACPVTQPTISTSVRCQSPTDITVNYTCNHAGGTIIWASTIFRSPGEFTTSFGSANNPDVLLDSGVTGVMAAEMHTTESDCINSTLTITGSNLLSLDGKSLTCREGGNSHTITISISELATDHTNITLRNVILLMS